MSKKILLISFSGGRTSAFMLYWILNSGKYKDWEIIVVFANTGKEREETLEFVNQVGKKYNIDIIWIEAEHRNEHGKKNWFRIVDFETASRNGEPFEAFIKKERIPNAAYPNCSGRLKSIPIHAYMKHHISKDYYTAIGIRFDEKHRIKSWEKAKKEKLIYPLITDYRVDSGYIRKFWENQTFDLGCYIPKHVINKHFYNNDAALKWKNSYWKNEYLYSYERCTEPHHLDTDEFKFVPLLDYEGNCDMCWKKTKRKHLTMIAENPSLINWWNEMEIKYGQGEYHFFRNNESAKELIDRSKKPFRRWEDVYLLSKDQESLFDDELDIGASCFCR